MGDFENNVDDEMDLRRGPWTVEEDFKLSNYISTLGEGRWNSLARCAGMIHYRPSTITRINTQINMFIRVYECVPN